MRKSTQNLCARVTICIITAMVWSCLVNCRAAAPQNDDFANRILLTSTNSLLVWATNTEATTEFSEPPACGNGGSVWWTWTAPDSGRAELYITNTVTTGCLQVFTGDSLGALIPATAEGNSFMTRVGTTYQIRASTLEPLGGTFQWRLRLRKAPYNDDFDYRELLSSVAFISNTNATRQEGDPTRGGHSLWWTWLSPTTSNHTIRARVDASECSFDPEIGIYSGTSLSNLVLESSFIRVDARHFEFLVNRSGSYNFVVDGPPGVVKFHLQLSEIAWNDNFADRIPTTGNDVVFLSTTDAAGREPGEPPHFGRATGRSVWWEWTAPLTGGAEESLLWSTLGLEYKIAVYRGNSLSNLELVAQSPGKVHLTFPVQEGEKYQIVAETPAESPGSQVNFMISVSPSPTNDAFLNRAALAGTNLSFIVSNAGGTVEPGERSPRGFWGYKSVWWKWKAPVSGWAVLSGYQDVNWAAGYVPVADLGVYTGETLTDLVPVTETELSYFYPNAPFTISKGTEYQILVDGYWQGSFSLTLSSISDDSDRDKVAPDISCPPDLKVPCSDPYLTEVNYSVLANDDHDGPVPVICTPPSGSAFPHGFTAVHCSASDTAGNTTNCSFRVMVYDPDPPTVDCPTKLVVDFTDQDGANVPFSLSVTSRCAQITTVCQPPPGQFPIGVTPVLCRVSTLDQSGNLPCSFPVQVLGPREVIQDCLGLLNALEAPLAGRTPGRLDHILDEASTHLAGALKDEAWETETRLNHGRGNIVFLESKSALLSLDSVGSATNQPGLRSTLHTVITRLVKVDRFLATTAIAAAAGKTSPKREDQAKADLLKADLVLTEPDYRRGIELLRTAWKWCQLPVVTLGPQQAAADRELTVDGNPTDTYRVEASADLLNWTSIGRCAVGTNGTAKFVDQQAAGQNIRFYRITFE